MKKLIVTTQAKRDLRNIHDYIAQDNPHNARVFIAVLSAKIEWIAEVDFTGSPRDHIREGLRGFPYRNRCIYYRSYDDHIAIIRVIHGSQDIDKQEL